MKISVTLPLLLLLIVYCGFAQGPSAEPVHLTISGASTIQPAAEHAAELYRQLYGSTAVVRGGGSGAGIRDIASGTSDIGMVSRGLSPAEQDAVVPALFALDALVFIVNAANPLETISKTQVLELYSGTVRSWAPLGGHDSPVVLVSKERGRATLDLFEGYTGLHHPAGAEPGPAGKIDPSVLEIASNLESITLVGGIPNAVGYVSLGAAETLLSMDMPIKILSLDGVSPTRENVLSKRYPIIRELNLIVREPGEQTDQFIELFFGEEMKQFLTGYGFIPVKRQTR